MAGEVHALANTRGAVVDMRIPSDSWGKMANVQQRSWLLYREGHGQRTVARALHMDFFASVIIDDECWKGVLMHDFL